MDIKKLQEKLEGVTDFDNPEDCKRIIEMLLRDLERANGRAEGNATRLKMLAYLVSKNKSKAKEKAEEILSGVQKSKVEVWDMLMGMSNEMGRAESLDDRELLDDVHGNVWGELPMDSRESAVLEELIRRYKKKAGIHDIPDKVS